MRKLKPPKYTKERLTGYWWDIKKGNKVIGYIAIGSTASKNLRYQFYVWNNDPPIPVGYGFRTVQDAFNAYIERFPLNE
jgi:hypothetical protein